MLLENVNKVRKTVLIFLEAGIVLTHVLFPNCLGDQRELQMFQLELVGVELFFFFSTAEGQARGGGAVAKLSNHMILHSQVTFKST